MLCEMALILLSIFTIASLIQAKSPCRCNGKLSHFGGGQCKTSHNGRAWCYVDNDAGCSDKKRGWSYEACEAKKSCVCNGFVSKQGGGQCRTKYNGQPWCFIDKDANCPDRRRGWSFQACQNMSSVLAHSDPVDQQAVINQCRDEKDESCIFPFKHNGQVHTKCSMEGSTEPWCATAVDQYRNVKTKGVCSPERSSPTCFPKQFWKEAKVYSQDENGTIPCQDLNDCPIYDRNTMRKILGVGTLWDPFMTCGTTNGNKICAFEISHSIFPIRVSGGKPLTLSSSKSSCGNLKLKMGLYDIGVAPFNEKRVKVKAGFVEQDCEDPSTCRRGNYCCTVVWANNRQFVCPHVCDVPKHLPFIRKSSC